MAITDEQRRAAIAFDHEYQRDMRKLKQEFGAKRREIGANYDKLRDNAHERYLSDQARITEIEAKELADVNRAHADAEKRLRARIERKLFRT
jgi:hypothetical protein